MLQLKFMTDNLTFRRVIKLFLDYNISDSTRSSNLTRTLLKWKKKNEQKSGESLREYKFTQDPGMMNLLKH